jgi:hypothetical protein
MNVTPDTTASNGGTFDPREAAALLDQTSREARRQLSPAQPWLLSIRGVLVLAALGAVWFSVRDQHPYQGPHGSALLIVVAFVILNFAATMAVRARAVAGVSGRSRFSPVEIAVLAASWVVPYVVMAALGVTGDSQSGYLLTVPLISAGLTFAAVMAVRSAWRSVGTGIAVAVTGAAGAIAGQPAVWAVVGVGLSITLLGSAAAVAWQLHRA